MGELSGFNLQSLVIFYHVAKEKNLTSAAEKLCLTQPGITYHIRLLEKHFAVKLFNVQKARVVLTPAGEGIYKYTEKIYKLLVDTELFIKSLTESSLNVGLETVFVPIVASILDIFKKDHPQVKLVVRSGESNGIINDLLGLKLDVAIVHQIKEPSKYLTQIFTGPPRKLVCFASSNMTLPDEPLEWEDLSKYSFVMGLEPSTIRKVIENKFTEKGLATPRLSAEVNSTDWHKRFVMNGTCLSFTLQENIEQEVSRGLLRIVPLKEELYIPFMVVIRSEETVNKNIMDFAATLKQAISVRD